MNSYLALILQTVAVIASVVTVMWRIQTRLNDKTASALAAIRKEFSDETAALRAQIERIEELRRKGDHALHERINTLESGIYREMNQRLSTIEGQLKGIDNITKVMERWLVDHGAKVS